MKKYELAIKKTYKEDNKNLLKSRKDYGRCPVDFRPVDRQYRAVNTIIPVYSRDSAGPVLPPATRRHRHKISRFVTSPALIDLPASLALNCCVFVRLNCLPLPRRKPAIPRKCNLVIRWEISRDYLKVLAAIIYSVVTYEILLAVC